METAPPAPGHGDVPRHVAWVARQAGGASTDQHERDQRALLALVETAVRLGVGWLTVQNPSRGRALRDRADELAARGIAVAVAPETALDAPRPGDLVPLVSPPVLRVLLAEEGSGRQELVGVVRELAARGARPKDVDEATIGGLLAVPDVDLLVLTGGDRRVPDILVWQVAYSEIVVLDESWLDVTAAHFDAAVAEYQRRNRRYGGLVASR